MRPVRQPGLLDEAPKSRFVFIGSGTQGRDKHALLGVMLQLVLVWLIPEALVDIAGQEHKVAEAHNAGDQFSAAESIEAEVTAPVAVVVERVRD